MLLLADGAALAFGRIASLQLVSQFVVRRSFAPEHRAKTHLRLLRGGAPSFSPVAMAKQTDMRLIDTCVNLQVLFDSRTRFVSAAR